MPRTLRSPEPATLEARTSPPFHVQSWAIGHSGSWGVLPSRMAWFTISTRVDSKRRENTAPPSRSVTSGIPKLYSCVR